MTGYGDQLGHWQSLIALILTKSSSVINSFIYGIRQVTKYSPKGDI
jgi:hypothetical protein